jgi:hypothetical protein
MALFAVSYQSSQCVLSPETVSPTSYFFGAAFFILFLGLSTAQRSFTLSELLISSTLVARVTFWVASTLQAGTSPDLELDFVLSVAASRAVLLISGHIILLQLFGATLSGLALIGGTAGLLLHVLFTTDALRVIFVNVVRLCPRFSNRSAFTHPSTFPIRYSPTGLCSPSGPSWRSHSPSFSSYSERTTFFKRDH